MSKEFNGWTNWETWNCNLWYENMDDYAQEIFDDLDFSLSHKSLKNEFTRKMADCIESIIEESADEFIGKKSSSFFADLINASLREINYWEIASHYWEVVDKSKLEEYLEELKEEEEESELTNE